MFNPLLLTCSDSGDVSDAADYAAEQTARWLHIAHQIGRTPSSRGYRLAVSRAGTWTLRADIARRRMDRATLTRDQRIDLARLEADDTREAAYWYDFATFGDVRDDWADYATGAGMVAK